MPLSLLHITTMSPKLFVTEMYEEIHVSEEYCSYFVENALLAVIINGRDI